MPSARWSRILEEADDEDGDWSGGRAGVLSRPGCAVRAGSRHARRRGDVLEGYRPWFLGLTAVLLGAAVYVRYRPAAPKLPTIR